MWKELEEDDNLQDSGETDTLDYSKDSELNTSSEKGKWKFDVWKEYKKLKKENAELKKTDYSDDREEEDEEEIPKSKNSTKTADDDIRLELFMIKNPEAQSYEKEIKKVLSNYPNMPYAEAYSFAKVHYTKSETQKDFTTKSSTPKKDIKDMSKEEVLALKDSKKLLEWSRATWQIR